jgi:hypothetical protein
MVVPRAADIFHIAATRRDFESVQHIADCPGEQRLGLAEAVHAVATRELRRRVTYVAPV